MTYLFEKPYSSSLISAAAGREVVLFSPGSVEMLKWRVQQVCFRVHELDLVFDVSKPWEEIAQIGDGWDTTNGEAKGLSSYEITCVKSGTQHGFCPEIVITLKKQCVRRNLVLTVALESSQRRNMK